MSNKLKKQKQLRYSRDHVNGEAGVVSGNFATRLFMSFGLVSDDDVKKLTKSPESFYINHCLSSLKYDKEICESETYGNDVLLTNYLNFMRQ